MAEIDTHRPNILDTIDEFVGIVPWGDHRVVTVSRWHHGDSSYDRLRIWNQHRTKRVWYPTKHAFVVPIGNVDTLLEVLDAAVRGVAGPKPDWLIAREVAERRPLERVEDLEAPTRIRKRALAILRLRQRVRL